MSKSLKNFISIRTYLNQHITSHPADDFRLFCIQNKYDSLITYSEDRIRDAAIVREKIQSFFAMTDLITKKVRQLDSDKRTTSSSSIIETKKPSDEAKMLMVRLKTSQLFIHQSLQNDFHTPAVLQEVLDLISNANSYGNRVLQQLSERPVDVKSHIYVDQWEPIIDRKSVV